MYTVFEIKSKKGGARQININKINQILQIDYQKNTKSGDKIFFNNVLNHEGNFGQPYLKGLQVIGEVIKHGKRKKIVVFKYKPKKRYSKKQGHRQQYTQIKIIGIENN